MYYRMKWSAFYLAFIWAIASQAPSSIAFADVNDGTPMLPQGKNATALVDKLIGRVNSLDCYKFDASLEARTGNKTSKASGTFYFKPTNAVRVEVKKYGSKSGSILVRSQDGKIRGKGGPQMMGMKMTLSPDSRLLRMPNGLSAVECDLGSLLKKLRKEAGSGLKLVSTEQPMQIEGLGTRAIVIESQRTDDASDAVVDRVYIDPSQKLPLQWDMFENGKFWSRSKFQNFQSNMHLDDSEFSL